MIATSGTGTISLQSSARVSVASSSTLSTVNGGITLVGNATGTTVGNFRGVQVSGSSIVRTTGTGNVTLTGKGGIDATTSSHDGVLLVSGAVIESTASGLAANHGLITLTGTSSAAVTGYTTGVYITSANTRVSSVSGDITITGQGASTGTADGQFGIQIWTNPVVESTGTAKVTITGTAGHDGPGIDVEDGAIVRSTGSGDLLLVSQGSTNDDDGNEAYGILIQSMVTTTGSGTLTLRGIGGGKGAGDNDSGILIGGYFTATVTVSSTGSGNITLQGKAGSGASNTVGIDIRPPDGGGSGGITSSGTGSVTLAADSIKLQTGATFAAGSNVVTLRPATTSDIASDDNGDTIDIGSTSDNSGASNNLELSDAELDLITAGTIAVGDTSSGTITISADLTQPGKNLTLTTGAGVTGSANIINGSATATTVTINQVGNSTYSGLLGGPSGGTANDKNLSLVKLGSGTLTLSGANTFVGTVTINAGTLSVSSDANLGNTANTIKLGDGTGTDTLAITTGFSTARQITLNAGIIDVSAGLATISGKITGSGGLTKTGDGTLVLSNNTNDYTGVTSIQSGRILINASNALGATGAANKTIIASGGMLDLQSSISVAETLTISGTGGGSGALRNSFSNNALTGPIDLDAAATIMSEAGSSLTISTGGIDTDGFALTFSGPGPTTVSGEISDTGSVTKTGTGTLTLSGTNSYTGTTTVSQGTLLVDGSIANGTAATDVSVASGATLGGTGTISGTVSVSSGGTITLAGGTILTTNGGTPLPTTGDDGDILSKTSVESGATLGGTGTVTGTVTVQSGGTLSPGASPGILSTGSISF